MCCHNIKIVIEPLGSQWCMFKEQVIFPVRKGYFIAVLLKYFLCRKVKSLSSDDQLQFDVILLTFIWANIFSFSVFQVVPFIKSHPNLLPLMAHVCGFLRYRVVFCCYLRIYVLSCIKCLHFS